MKINNIHTIEYCQNTGFNGSVCKTVYKRAEKFCSPDKMEKLISSYQADVACRPMTAETSKLSDKYEEFMIKNGKKMFELNQCMKNRFSDSVFLTVRKVKETENKKSVLSLFNTETGKILDVSTPFDTNYGDISNIFTRFVKRAHSYVAEIEKP